MYLVVGLGNPGGEYAATRHNIGFLFLDYLAEKFRFSFKGTRWQAEAAREQLWGHTVLLAKPTTFMNRSGTAVGAIAHFYQISNSNIIVVHDDLDLPLGRAKIVTNRGAGGHNGIRSLIECLGGKDFIRIRVGIGRPRTPEGVSSFVLSRFSPEEKEILRNGLQDVEEGVALIVEKGLAVAMNRFNTAE